MKTKMILLTVVVICGLVAGSALSATTDEKVKKNTQRIQELEKDNAKDRIDFSGEYRFQAANLGYEFPDYYNGMALQGLMINSMFAMQMGVAQPGPGTDLGAFLGVVQNTIAQNYDAYQYMMDNLSWQGLQQMMGSADPNEIAQLQGFLLPATYQEGYKVNNDILYTNRLRLNMRAKVAKNVSFTGRLAMYKTFGDATGVQVFNGQSNSFVNDGNSAHVPNGDFLRVERAYFTWTDLFHAPLYLSIGRRPSTDGPPMHLRNNEKRAGSPMASLIDMQFDGITFGWNIADWTTARICYGLGYESQYGNGVLDQNPLDDAHFLGLNWDVYDKGNMFGQITVARGIDVTDGFNGLIVMPVNAINGQPVPGPMVMRYTPSANMGDIDIMGALFMREDGPVDWFLNFNYMKSHPDNVTTPFGGLFCDPMQTPESQDATMFYLGGRFKFNEEKTKVGVEYNHGSQYWFNFTPAQDDLIAPKTNTRGDVWEGYITHDIARRFIVKLAYINYQYKYSGSGWHMGAPKELDQSPVLGFPTYKAAHALTLSMMARF